MHANSSAHSLPAKGPKPATDIRSRHFPGSGKLLKPGDFQDVLDVPQLGYDLVQLGV